MHNFLIATLWTLTIGLIVMGLIQLFWLGIRGERKALNPQEKLVAGCHIVGGRAALTMGIIALAGIIDFTILHEIRPAEVASTATYYPDTAISKVELSGPEWYEWKVEKIFSTDDGAKAIELTNAKLGKTVSVPLAACQFGPHGVAYLSTNAIERIWK